MSYGDYPFDEERPPTGGQRSGRGSRRAQFAQQAQRDRGEYVEVDVRILEFYQLHPNGRLVTTKVKLTDKPDGVPRVIVTALAFRDPDDPFPGVGTSWMELPGKTPYTKGSEVENAETSAWGRAIAALGIAVRTGIATRHEVDSKRDATPEELAQEAGLEVASVGEAVAAAAADGAPVAPEATPVTREASVGTETPTDTPAAPEAAPVAPEGLLLSFEAFMARCKERFIPAPTISKHARDLYGDSATSIRELTDQQRGFLWETLESVLSGGASVESPTKSEPSTST